MVHGSYFVQPCGQLHQPKAQSTNTPAIIFRHYLVSPIKLRPTLLACTTRKHAQLSLCMLFTDQRKSTGAKAATVCAGDCCLHSFIKL